MIKSFSYRGATRQFSNRYYFDGPTITGATAWDAFTDAITTAERPAMTPAATIIGTVAYDAGSEVPVRLKTYSLVGTVAVSTSPRGPGDAAALVRYSTADRSAKNHPIYLFNYYHGVYLSTGATPDDLLSAERTALATYGASWVSGFTVGGDTHRRTGPYGHVATGVLVDPYIRHRDFPAA